jgi:hypothetical protein
LEKNEVRINLEIRSPNTIETKAMEAITIPVLLGKDVKGQKTKMLLIEDNLIFETSTGYQSFETCEKIGGVIMCDLNEEKSKSSPNCIKWLLINNIEQTDRYCQTKPEYTQDSRYSRNTPVGELISTQEPLFNQNKIFEPMSPGTGVIFLKKTDMQRTFPCNKRMINVGKSNFGEINIVNHSAKFNLTKLINSERMPYIEDKTTKLKKKIKINSDIIELFGEKTQQKLQETELNQKKLKNQFPKKNHSCWIAFANSFDSSCYLDKLINYGNLL